MDPPAPSVENNRGGTLENNSSLEKNCGGTLKNNSSMENNSSIENNSGGTLENEQLVLYDLCVGLLQICVISVC